MAAQNLQQFIIIILYGSLILHSFIVLVNPMNVNRKANLFFGLFLFLWSTYWILDVLALCGLPTSIAFTTLVYLLQIFTPLFLYFSVVFFINPNYKFQKADLVCLIVPVVYAVLLLFPPHNALYSTIPISHNLPYIAIVYFKIRRHQKRMETISSNTEGISLQWLIKITSLLFFTIVITVGYELYNLYIEKRHEHVVMDLLFLVIIYLTSYYSLRQKEIYPLDEGQRKELLAIEADEGQEERKKLLSDAELEALKQKLSTLMETEKPYLDGELNLIKLAGLTGISAHQLSYLINQGFSSNFFQFVNGYRVAHAKVLLQDDKKNKLSLLGIAYESGFNSKTSFNTIFKKIAQLTPSEFRNKK